MNAPSLYPHQLTAIDGVRDSLRSGRRRPVLALPTGAGKTIIATEIIQSARAKGKRVCFTAPLLNLIGQTFERFTSNGIDPADIGVIQGNHEWRRPQAPIQIASVQTLARRGFPETDFVIVDEAHLQFDVIYRWMQQQPGKVFVGLSATPWARGMADWWDDLVIGANIKDLIADGYLSPFRVFAPSKPDLSGVRTVAGDYAEGQLSERMSSRKIVADVVASWLELSERRPTLLFAVDRAHAATLHDEFTSVGVRSEYVDANTPREEREAIAARFQAGEIDVICSISTMGTGVDLDVRCIVHARPTKSEMRWVQDFGRGLRTAKGKTDLIVLDHGGTALRLGFPTDIGRNELLSAKGAPDQSDAVSVESTPTPRECGQCKALIPAKTLACPNCGFVAKRVSNIICEDGELAELGVAPSPKPEKQAGSATERLRAQGKQAVYSQLLSLQGPKADGWVSWKYKTIFDVWPRGLDKVPSKPTPELSSWLRSESIRWAKGKGARRDQSENDQRELADAD